MLNELHIENIAVIERADVSFGSGLNILTGETGAGKSILVDAMYAVLGGRVTRELVRTGADKAVVCATFDPESAAEWCAEHEIDLDDELILRRQISADGKSTCRICGVPVPASQLRELGSLLLDIHGKTTVFSFSTSAAIWRIWMRLALGKRMCARTRMPFRRLQRW